MFSYWFEVRVKLRAVLRPVFNTPFLFQDFIKANIYTDSSSLVSLSIGIQNMNIIARLPLHWLTFMLPMG